MVLDDQHWVCSDLVKCLEFITGRKQSGWCEKLIETTLSRITEVKRIRKHAETTKEAVSVPKIRRQWLTSVASQLTGSQAETFQRL